MFGNLHYLGVSKSDRSPYLLNRKIAESWPVEGLRLFFFSNRMERTYALSYWLNYFAQNPLDWLTPSEDAWAIDLTRLQTTFDDVDGVLNNRSPVTWPTWFKGQVALVPDWQMVEQGNGHNRFAFILTEWQVTKSKLPPIAGTGTTIIQGDQIHLSGIHGNVGHVGSHSSDVSIAQHVSATEQENMGDLAEELALLRAELRRRAETVEEDRTVAAIGEAEEAARKGEGGKALALLKKAGSWALKTATEIGTPIAQKAIETAIGV